MKGVIAIGFIFMLYIIWQVRGAVNCTDTGAGRFADPNDTTCQNYTLCVYANSSYLSYNYVCPTTSLFNPASSLCSNNYTCNSTSTDSTSTNSTFTCSTSGRFANTTDTTCRTYRLCVLATNGTFSEYDYTCPTTSVFSPTSNLCTTNYTCPTS